jgi:uncharacterized protein YcbX
VPLVLGELRVHPVKSCGGIPVTEWELDRFGLALDRAFMVVDADRGLFLTQREEPRLALVAPRIAGAELVLAAAGAGEVAIDLARTEGPRREVEVWRHRGLAVDQGETAAEWLSELLGRALRLVRIPPDHARLVNPERSPEPAHTAFSDGYPLLVLSRASLGDLNGRLPAALAIERFRPNLVIEGAEPYAEDGWRRIRIGAIELDVVKPCDRCGITTVDPATGARDGREPLRTLNRYRRRDGAVWFGQNAVHRGTGKLAAGMPIEVLATQPRAVFDGA